MQNSTVNTAHEVPAGSLPKSSIEQPYRYSRTRSGPVFALALLASLCALGIVWGAWSALDSATERHDIAQPPDLKIVMKKVSSEASGVVAKARAPGEGEDR